MKKVYEAPVLMCEEFAPDTMIASHDTKKGNPDNNQNCWWCRNIAAQTDQFNPENSCFYLPNTAAWNAFC